MKVPTGYSYLEINTSIMEIYEKSINLPDEIKFDNENRSFWKTVSVITCSQHALGGQGA